MLGPMFDLWGEEEAEEKKKKKKKKRKALRVNLLPIAPANAII